MDDNHPLPNPKSLKTLTSTVQYSGGKTLLHQLVLDNSDRNISRSEGYIHAALMSICDIDVNAVNDEGYTALHLAVLKENLFMVRKLLSCLPDILVNKRCTYNPNNTALHLAAELSHVLIIEELLNKGANINKTNSQCRTPLRIAALSGDLGTTKFLVCKGADVNAIDDSLPPVFDAAASGNVKVVQYLLSRGSDVSAKDKENYNLLCHAARLGQLAIVEFFADKGPELNAQNGQLPLDLAALSGNLDVVKFLLDRIQNADIDCMLLSAAFSGNLGMLQFLVDKGADVNVQQADTKMTPLHQAMRTSTDLASLEFLVNMGADLDAKDKESRTPLHEAAYEKNIKMAAFLIEQGADLHSNDRSGQTPLHVAVRLNNLEYAQLLISRGADVHATDADGETPLHGAVFYNDTACAELLISKGVDLNVEDKKGRTPLDAAIFRGKQEVIDLLTERGAHAIFYADGKKSINTWDDLPFDDNPWC